MGALLAAAPGCASTGVDGGGAKLRVSLEDYASDQRFELASESHTDRVEYYSTPRSDAARKVQDDRVMALLLGELEDRGLDEHAQEGPAPARGSRVITRAFEIERDGELSHWAVGPGSAPEQRIAFNDCVQQFLQIYNVSASFQTVHNPEGPALFEEARRETATKGGEER